MKMPTFEEEISLWKNEIEYVIGVDEVGRGCFAGPVTAGTVIFKKNTPIKNVILSKINDSKLLNPKKRQKKGGSENKQFNYFLHIIKQINQKPKKFLSASYKAEMPLSACWIVLRRKEALTVVAASKTTTQISSVAQPVAPNQPATLQS